MPRQNREEALGKHPEKSKAARGEGWKGGGGDEEPGKCYAKESCNVQIQTLQTQELTITRSRKIEYLGQRQKKETFKVHGRKQRLLRF
jgi:hypothetical protein